MDAQLTDLPFHAVTGHTHSNWARTFHCHPELYIQPQNLEQLQEVIKLARRCRRRIAVTGCGHSPSDLTCTSAFLVNLDHLEKILDINHDTRMVVMEAGIRLHDLGLKLKQHGLAMPNLGSIDHQSIAGAIGTGTHGSSLRHGLLSESVRALKLMLMNGDVMYCSADQNADLFRAALVSLGGLGIIIEVTFEAVPAFDIEWAQSLHPLDEILADWEVLWREHEFTRVWWLPYSKQCIKWRADKTEKPPCSPVSNWWSGKIGFHTYQMLLYCAQWVPSILPLLERFVTNVQYGFKDGVGNVGVEEGRTGLLMNCLFSQWVNEFAVPFDRGPETIKRLSSWLNGEEEDGGIPFNSRGLYVHAPIEVRVTDSSNSSPRPYLDNTNRSGSTLYLNATLYRPYNSDPPCRERYYEAFEWLMKEMGGRPHWAKNFSTVTRQELRDMYPEMDDWIGIRNRIDPNGMFVGDWHRRHLLPDKGGGLNWTGDLSEKNSRK